MTALSMEYGATTLNLASIIEHHARLAPEKEAIVWNEMRFTYGQLTRCRIASRMLWLKWASVTAIKSRCLPESAVFPDCLLRDYESGRGGRAAQCFVQAARNRLSPARFGRESRFRF
jgi:hypothetical protein